MKTPQQTYPELARALGVQEIYLKREDLHQYQSHKGRSIPLMLKRYVKEGHTNFVISSSGNAALAAALAADTHNRNNPDRPITLTMYVGPHADPKKRDRLKAVCADGSGIAVEQVERPKQTAFRRDAAGTAKFLRQSTDDLALEGYYSLAQELSKIPELQAVFIPTSSGTTAQAMGETFQELHASVQLHVVQTEACHPIAEEFDADVSTSDHSVAGAIVDNVAHRKPRVVELVRHSNGSGWIVTDEEIQAARALVKQKTNIDISANSALSVAGLQKALRRGHDCTGVIACLITGA